MLISFKVKLLDKMHINLNVKNSKMHYHYIDGILLKGRIPQKSKNQFLVSKFSEKIGA
jgi:hypothetical protein